MPAFGDLQDLLELGLCLQQEILRRSAADDQRGALPPPLFALRTMPAVSLTSMLGSMTGPIPASLRAATFMPMLLSPGDEV